MCVFLPKIHCKLNPIERVWCHAKKHVKTKNIGSRSISHSGSASDRQVLDTVKVYESAYRDGHIESAIKK